MEAAKILLSSLYIHRKKIKICFAIESNITSEFVYLLIWNMVDSGCFTYKCRKTVVSHFSYYPVLIFVWWQIVDISILMGVLNDRIYLKEEQLILYFYSLFLTVILSTPIKILCLALTFWVVLLNAYKSNSVRQSVTITKKKYISKILKMFF